jgi:hypothetical protein
MIEQMKKDRKKIYMRWNIWNKLTGDDILRLRKESAEKWWQVCLVAPGHVLAGQPVTLDDIFLLSEITGIHRGALTYAAESADVLTSIRS